MRTAIEGGSLFTYHRFEHPESSVFAEREDASWLVSKVVLGQLHQSNHSARVSASDVQLKSQRIKHYNVARGLSNQHNVIHRQHARHAYNCFGRIGGAGFKNIALERHFDVARGG